jgi:hypothetical protein
MSWKETESTLFGFCLASSLDCAAAPEDSGTRLELDRAVGIELPRPKQDSPEEERQ